MTLTDGPTSTIRIWECPVACQRITTRVILVVKSIRGWTHAVIGASLAEGIRGMSLRAITGAKLLLKVTRDMIRPEASTAVRVNATVNIANEEKKLKIFQLSFLFFSFF